MLEAAIWTPRESAAATLVHIRSRDEDCLIEYQGKIYHIKNSAKLSR